jgi:putative inorganic carbon (hco3(-)) transporter
MDFALFVILNAILLIRPEELQPDIAGLRLYLIVISLTTLSALPRLVQTLHPSELAKSPITVCVLGVWCAGILSQLVRGQFGLAADFAGEFGKVILYYLLLVSIIDTPGRLRAFLGWLIVFVVIISSLGLLQYHGMIDNDALRPLERKTNFDEETGDYAVVNQLRSTGIYNDPNDLCLILVTGSICALYRATTAGGPALKVLWLAPIGLFGYAVILTQSRGGLLGLMVAVATWAYGRFGWKTGVLISTALLPAMMFLSGGRQTEIGAGSDTAQARVHLWSEGLVAMMRNPITGIGPGEYAEEMSQVAHNSFVHAYVEMGLVGGSLFLGAFALSAVGPLRVNAGRNPRLLRLRPFLLAIIIGYAGGAFSLSRDYIVPTYMVLGLAEVFTRMAPTVPPTWFRTDGKLVLRILAVGVVGLVVLKVLTQALIVVG